MTPEELQRVQALASELKLLKEQGVIGIELEPGAAFELIGMIQLALRHPAIPEQQQSRWMQFAQGLAQAFPEGSTAAQVIERGWNPGHDRKVEIPKQGLTVFNFGQKLVNDLNANDPNGKWEILGIEEL